MNTLKLKFPLLYQLFKEVKGAEYFLVMNEEVIKFNKKINLISPATIGVMESVHFLDSVLGSQLILKDSPSLEFYDAGSGNGFPGLILASLDSQRSVKLVESDQRKAEFIEHCAFKMNLSNVEVICDRVESLALSSPVVFVSRAFSSIPKALNLYKKASPLGFRAYHFKSANWASELIKPSFLDDNVPHGTKLSGQFMHKPIGKYQLPHNSQDFYIIRSAKQ